MEARQLEKEAKILLTEIAADRNRAEGLVQYGKMCAAAFASYSLIKLSLNYFTLCEMEQEEAEEGDRSEDYWTVQSAVRGLLSATPEKEEEQIRTLRDRITARMKVLTSYTDFFEQHEYIMNRKEAGLLGQVEQVSPENLADEAFSFVFSDQDKMVVNTRIQSVVGQLPVRMTKQRFYDILSEAIALYQGGELQSARDFIQSIREAALLELPEGFETEYPELKERYDLFDHVTYKDLSKAEYENLQKELESVTGEMEGYATRDLLLQEIVNDILVVQLTAPRADASYLEDRAETAKKILQEIITAEDIYVSAEQFDEWFLLMEGAQEEAYEALLTLESSLESYADELEPDVAKALKTADLLTSTSLFMDLNEKEESADPEERAEEKAEDKAEDKKLEQLKEQLFTDFDQAFAVLSREEKRSRMAKVLSMVPVFFNSREEIREYFLYALENCRDDSELTAVSRLIHDMMLDK